MTQAQAGWYPQPDGTQRYWDGAAWTEHVASGAALAAPAMPQATPMLAEPPAAPVAAAPTAQPPVVPPDQPAALSEPPAVHAAPPAPQTVYAAAPSATPAAKPRKRVWPWVLGIGGATLLVIIGLVVWAVVALIGAAKGPGEAVTGLDSAWRDGDCAAMERLTTADLRASSGWDDCEVFRTSAPTSADGLSLVVESTTITNGVATVTTTEEWNDGADPHTGTYTVIKVDGDWTVSAAEFE